MVVISMAFSEPALFLALFFFLLKARATELSLPDWLSNQTGGSSATL
jgi:hypothetical protein